MPGSTVTPPVCPNPRYELLSRIGAGAQGSTWRARDLETGGHVAVKVFDLSRAEDWKPFDLFERECRVLRSLDHPGIPRFLDDFADEAEGRYFLVMELRAGASLREVAERRATFDDDELMAVLLATLDVLEYLHARTPPVIHRDIKPSNLILEADGSVALVDFGGVRVALRPEGGSTMVGTFGYMAPEQLHGEAGPATDIYGLGATIAALAAGMEAEKLPRKGLRIDLGAVLRPSPMRDALEGMLAPDPTQRLATVAAVRARLGAAEPERQGPRGASLPAPQVRGPGGLISFMLFVVSSLVAAVLYFAGHFVVPTVLRVVAPRRHRRMSDRRKRRRERLTRDAERAQHHIETVRQELKRVARANDPERPGGSPSPRLPPRGPSHRGSGRRGGRRG